MTIKPGSPWGVEVPRPPRLHVAATDCDLTRALAADATPVAAGGGDLARTLGSPPLAGRTTLTAFPIDLVDVRLDGVAAPRPACAHVVARNADLRGGWLRGPVVVVMNAEFMGRWDVAPRGHPDDGRVETFEVGADLGLRQRWEARRRLPLGTHLPHPGIRTGTVRAASWEFAEPLQVRIDGARVGSARVLEVVVRPDAATVLA